MHARQRRLNVLTQGFTAPSTSTLAEANRSRWIWTWMERFLRIWYDAPSGSKRREATSAGKSKKVRSRIYPRSYPLSLHCDDGQCTRVFSTRTRRHIRCECGCHHSIAVAEQGLENLRIPRWREDAKDAAATCEIIRFITQALGITIAP